MKLKEQKTRAAILCVAGVLIVMSGLATMQGQTLKVLDNFTGGSQPSFPSGLMPVLGRDGNLYLESYNGGTNGAGTVFNSSPSGTITVLHNKEAGCGPRWLTAGNDGNIYGACAPTASSPSGYIWKMTTTGTLTDLHDFNGSTEGSSPVAPLLASDGNLYGVTLSGGSNNLGTFYKFAPKTNTLTLLYTFANDGKNGYGPLCIPTQAASGLTFYCTTENGGANGLGTVFSITSTGTYKVLHSFGGGSTDGADGDSGVILGSDGNLYGVTRTGGTSGFGTVFKLTTAGVITLLHSFNGTSDGGYPANGLIQASDGNLYGTANDCASSCGTNQTAFKVTKAGTFSVLATFTSGGASGVLPDTGILQLTNGTFYGACEQGGTSNAGTLWSISNGLNAFILLSSTSGNVGSTVGIQGQGFSSSSVVKFDGVQATKVTLTGTTYLTATVPTGATDGYVTVTTGSTTLTSTQKYTVHNSWSSGTAIPVAVEASAAGLIGSKIYVVGGWNGTSIVNNNQIYNTSTNTWTTGAVIPTPVTGAANAVVSGLLYVIGGYEGASSTATNVVQIYNPTTNVWTTGAAMPTARGSATAVVDGTSIYVIGGNGSTNRLTTVEKYVPSSNTWTEEAPLLTGKSEPAAGLVSAKIVAPDGYTTSEDTGDNEEYNVSTNTWSSLTADPTPRNATCFGAISSVMYVAGGGDDGTPQSLAESFTLSTNKWATLLPIPQSTIFPAAAVANGQLYCFGGSNVDHGTGTVYNNVQIYQP